MLRIIEKNTQIFLRDDFTFDEVTEIGLDVDPAQGFYHPKWNGTEWVEGLTDEEITEITKPVLQEPTEADRLDMLELAILDLMME